MQACAKRNGSYENGCFEKDSLSLFCAIPLYVILDSFTHWKKDFEKVSSFKVCQLSLMLVTLLLWLDLVLMLL